MNNTHIEQPLQMPSQKNRLQRKLDNPVLSRASQSSVLCVLFWYRSRTALWNCWNSITSVYTITRNVDATRLTEQRETVSLFYGFQMLWLYLISGFAYRFSFQCGFRYLVCKIVLRNWEICSIIRGLQFQIIHQDDLLIIEQIFLNTHNEFVNTDWCEEMWILTDLCIVMRFSKYGLYGLLFFILSIIDQGFVSSIQMFLYAKQRTIDIH